jgi:transcriptional regulator with XRE-family HTH domain
MTPLIDFSYDRKSLYLQPKRFKVLRVYRKLVWLAVVRAGDPESKEAVARRMRLTRMALGLTQAEICRQTGIEQQVWNNSESADRPHRTGTNRLSVEAAVKLYRTYQKHIDFNWIYLGDKSGLSAEMATRIAKIERQLE